LRVIFPWRWIVVNELNMPADSPLYHSSAFDLQQTRPFPCTFFSTATTFRRFWSTCRKWSTMKTSKTQLTPCIWSRCPTERAFSFHYLCMTATSKSTRSHSPEAHVIVKASLQTTYKTQEKNTV
jgi:hypothetical protein